MLLKTNFRLQFLVIFSIFISLSLSAQMQENTSIPPAEAEKLIVKDWGASKKTMENFSIDSLRIVSINLVLDQNEADFNRIKFYKGRDAVNRVDLILTVGVDQDGKAVGNYFATSFSSDIGPCPDACD